MVVDRNPEVHSGAIVFRGTRVPVSTLTDILKAGGTIEEFLEGFPSVERWQVEAFLDMSPEAVQRLTSGPVRVLVDEDLDVRLRNHFGNDHEAITGRYRGWTGLTNGELLAAASAEFDVLVTADTYLQYQQNLPQYDIAVLVLRSRTTRLSDLLP